jgi:hypothetical protein
MNPSKYKWTILKCNSVIAKNIIQKLSINGNTFHTKKPTQPGWGEKLRSSFAPQPGEARPATTPSLTPRPPPHLHSSSFLSSSSLSSLELHPAPAPNRTGHRPLPQRHHPPLQRCLPPPQRSRPTTATDLTSSTRHCATLLQTAPCRALANDAAVHSCCQRHAVLLPTTPRCSWLMPRHATLLPEDNAPPWCSTEDGMPLLQLSPV